MGRRANPLKRKNPLLWLRTCMSIWLGWRFQGASGIGGMGGGGGAACCCCGAAVSSPEAGALPLCSSALHTRPLCLLLTKAGWNLLVVGRVVVKAALGRQCTAVTVQACILWLWVRDE